MKSISKLGLDRALQRASWSRITRYELFEYWLTHRLGPALAGEIDFATLRELYPYRARDRNVTQMLSLAHDSMPSRTRGAFRLAIANVLSDASVRAVDELTLELLTLAAFVPITECRAALVAFVPLGAASEGSIERRAYRLALDAAARTVTAHSEALDALCSFTSQPATFPIASAGDVLIATCRVQPKDVGDHLRRMRVFISRQLIWAAEIGNAAFATLLANRILEVVGFEYLMASLPALNLPGAEKDLLGYHSDWWLVDGLCNGKNAKLHLLVRYAHRYLALASDDSHSFELVANVAHHREIVARYSRQFIVFPTKTAVGSSTSRASGSRNWKTKLAGYAMSIRKDPFGLRTRLVRAAKLDSRVEP